MKHKMIKIELRFAFQRGLKAQSVCEQGLHLEINGKRLLEDCGEAFSLFSRFSHMDCSHTKTTYGIRDLWRWAITEQTAENQLQLWKILFRKAEGKESDFCLFFSHERRASLHVQHFWVNAASENYSFMFLYKKMFPLRKASEWRKAEKREEEKLNDGEKKEKKARNHPKIWRGKGKVRETKMRSHDVLAFGFCSALRLWSESSPPRAVQCERFSSSKLPFPSAHKKSFLSLTSSPPATAKGKRKWCANCAEKN